MKEDEFLFSEDNEGGVPKLDQLGQGEQPGPEGWHLKTVAQMRQNRRKKEKKLGEQFVRKVRKLAD